MNKYLIFLDDERNFDDVTWIDYPEYGRVYVVRTLSEFMFTVFNLEHLLKKYDFSFDHDLQDFSLGEDDEQTGYDCVKWLCEYTSVENIDITGCRFFFHTKNLVGGKNMETYISNYLKFVLQGGTL